MAEFYKRFGRFGVSSHNKPDRALLVSLIAPPTPLTRLSWMLGLMAN